MEEREFVLSFNVIDLQKIVNALELLPHRDVNKLITKIIAEHEKQSLAFSVAEAPKND